MATKIKDLVYCDETYTLKNGRTLTCERVPHTSEVLISASDAEFKLAHRAWYNGSEYQWGWIVDDNEVHVIQQGYRMPESDKEMRVDLLCGREIWQRVSYTVGVTTYAGLLVDVKHFHDENDGMLPRYTRIKLKVGDDIKTLRLEKDTIIRLYRHG